MKSWGKIILGILICLVGAWLVLNRPDTGLWTGSREDPPDTAPADARAIFSAK